MIHAGLLAIKPYVLEKMHATSQPRSAEGVHHRPNRQVNPALPAYVSKQTYIGTARQISAPTVVHGLMSYHRCWKQPLFRHKAWGWLSDEAVLNRAYGRKASGRDSSGVSLQG